MAIQPLTKPAAARDPVRIDSGDNTVELEEKTVRVRRIRYVSRENWVIYTHPAIEHLPEIQR